MLRLVCCAVFALLVTGCASHGVVDNAPGLASDPDQVYSIEAMEERYRRDDNALMLAFSGGGTRAAALSYGVLQELRDTPVASEDGGQRLLDEVHSIMSVSGGSFTAAYYGLHGDGIFDDYEEVFLRKNVQGALFRGAFNPLRWFSGKSRTEMAVDYYEKNVFKGATFADMRQKNGPIIVINASDLAGGVRFSFVQEYFNLLCSDLSSFSVARAVTASSAVPVLFEPVTVRNHPECGKEQPDWLKTAHAQAVGNPELAMVVKGMGTYFDRDNRPYVHFVDGGITDNMGLRALYEIVELAGGAKAFTKRGQRTPPRRLVMVSVNASTENDPEMSRSEEYPSLGETIGAVSSIQLRRYNVTTTRLMQRSLERWAQELSTTERPVEAYFIMLDFDDIHERERRAFLNKAPTSFSLTDEQVDALIEAGRDLLRNNAEFRRLLADMKASKVGVGGDF